MANLITAQEVIELAFAENSNMREESISDTSIRIAEIKYIKPVFGNMYSMLGTTYSDFTNEYIKPALAYFVKCEIVSSIAIDMSNSGIAVANPQYQSAASDKQRQRLYDSEMGKAKVLLDDALAYISAHAEEFPDFVGTAPKKHYRNGGLILGGGVSTRPTAIIGDAVSRKDFDALEDRVEDLERGGGGSTSDNNYTDADKALVQTIPYKVDRTDFDDLSSEIYITLDTKQDHITVTTKANGNIVLLGKEFMPATPSGDPMHYMYEAVGAVWNATTGFWQMYDMVDVTKEEMKKAFLLGSFNPNDAQPLNASVEQHPAWVRFNIPRNGSFAFYTSGGSSFAQNNKCLEFINLTFTSQISTSWLIANSQFVNAANAFNGCSNLRRICGPLEMSLTTNTTNMFAGCTKLTTVDVKALKQSISFADSPLLSKESILSMIENSNATSAITITLHATAYAMAMADADIKSALNSKTLVKLASA